MWANSLALVPRLCRGKLSKADASLLGGQVIGAVELLVGSKSVRLWGRIALVRVLVGSKVGSDKVGAFDFFHGTTKSSPTPAARDLAALATRATSAKLGVARF